jgi:hypothetical protein
MARGSGMGRIPHSSPSTEELQNRNDSRVGRGGGFGISKRSADEQYRKLLQGGAEGVSAPLPLPSRYGRNAKSGPFVESISVYNDEFEKAAGLGYDITAGEYLSYDANGNLTVPDYTNFAADARVGADMESPAPISIRPTSSSNPKRPRTVAAGYDPARKVLTVVFRDGTFYNYYDVGPQMWASFRGTWSKGWYIKRWLDKKPRGMADMSYVSARAQEELYRISRTNQLLFDAVQDYRTPAQARRQRKFERDTISEANRRARKAVKLGKNNTAAGKAPRPRKP